MSVILYKNGEASPPLHSVDAAGWKALGWAEGAEAPAVSPPPLVPDPGPPEGFVDGTTLKGKTTKAS